MNCRFARGEGNEGGTWCIFIKASNAVMSAGTVTSLFTSVMRRESALTSLCGGPSKSELSTKA
jgi:hypothetical protein